MKGIAIISVVVGHCSNSLFLETFVNQYHLAVFFFVAGYFFKMKYLNTPKDFVLKKIKRLYIPFVCAGVVFTLLHNALYEIHIYPNYINGTDILKELFHVTVRMVSHEPLMGAMWFCSAMLFVSLYSWGAFKIASLIKGNFSIQIKQLIVFSLLVWSASLCLYVLHLKSPYCIWQYMIVCGIFYEGYVFFNIEKLNKYRIQGGGKSYSMYYTFIYTNLINI